MKRILALIGAMALSLDCAAQSPAVPMDLPGFTGHTAKVLQAALPNGEVVVDSPATLKVGATKGQTTAVVSLDRIWRFCRDNPIKCPKALDDFAGRIVSATLASQTPTNVAAEQLRIVIRTSRDLDAMRQSAGRGPEAEPVSRILAGDLHIVCVADVGHGARILQQGLLKSLNLDTASALTLCLRQTEARLEPFPTGLQEEPRYGLGQISGDRYYVSSWLAFPGRWNALAQRFGGNLLVAIPASDVLLYIDGRREGAAARLRDAALYISRRAERPISPNVYHWAEMGWRVSE